jgi:mono/diheme cytochrome c family protein
MRSLHVALAMAFPVVVLAADLPPASTKTNVTYATDIRPIFEQNCFRCHGEKRARGDVRLDNLEAVLKGGEHGTVVIPGNSAKSSLVIAVARLDENSAMPPIKKGGPSKGGGGPAGAPPTAKPLTAEEVGLVCAWIDQGAK